MENKFTEERLMNRKSKVSTLDYSEELMLKYPEKFDWVNIFRLAKFSEQNIEAIMHALNENEWRAMFATQDLSEEFINKYYDIKYLDVILNYQKISVNFIEKHLDVAFQNNVNVWYNLSKNKKITKEIIEKYKNRLIWDTISLYGILPLELLEDYIDLIDINKYSSYVKLPDNLIEKYADKLNWNDLLFDHKLSEELIEKYLDKFLDFQIVTMIKYQSLSENFIEKHYNKFKSYITHILRNQELSEDFLYKHADDFENIDWVAISRYQKISEEFINKYLDKLDNVSLFYNKKISDAFIDKILNKIITDEKNNEEFMNIIESHVDWDKISNLDNLPTAFIEKYHEKINWKILGKKYFSEKLIDVFDGDYIKYLYINMMNACGICVTLK